MIKKTLCLFLIALLLISSVPVSAEEKQQTYGYDFDLSFSLNAQSFPVTMRKRMSGYAELINRLSIKGSVAWNDAAQSMDLNAVLYYENAPSLSLPFHLYGTKAWLFLTSPLMNNETLFFDLNGLMEYSVKVKNLLGLPLPYLALLYPYTTEHAFSGMLSAWQNVFGKTDKNKKLSSKQFRNLSDLWMDELQNNYLLTWWIKGVTEGSDAPYVVESFLYGIPYYLAQITEGNPVSVTVKSSSQTWRDKSGKTLFSQTESDDLISSSLTLPADENGYMPSYTYNCRSDGQTVSFDVAASVRREPSGTSTSEQKSINNENDEYSNDESYDAAEWDDEYEEEFSSYASYDEDGSGSDGNSSVDNVPDVLLDFSASGTDLPRAFPSDSVFTLSASVLGAVYPDFSVCIKGETKQDGTVTISFCKPNTKNEESVVIFQCSGLILPSENPDDVPNYDNISYLEDVHYVFAFNEQTLAAFSVEVLKPLVKNIISFVAAAPTSACQSLLDDMTDLGVLDMLLK